MHRFVKNLHWLYFMKTTQYIVKVFIYLFCILSVKTGWAQNVGISAASGFTPDASAGLDISYANKGLLVPRVALTATNAAGPITSPAVSLLVYNTATAGTAPNNVIPGYYYWNGVAWTILNTGTASANSSWATTGNTGTTAGTNFIGTTDAVDFVVKTNNIEKARFTSGGNVGIGGSSFDSSNPEKLLVDAGTTSSTNLVSGKGNINNFLQFNIQNLSGGNNASTDVVATADNGTDAANYIDMGINGSGNTKGFYYGVANDAYIYNAGGSVGGNLYIGNSTANKFMAFLTGGYAATNERMRIDGSGNIGIGTITPSTKLHVFGANPLTLSGVATGTNTTADSLLTITSGLVRKLPMSTFASSTGSWSTSGNAGTTAGTNFLGTTDAQDLVFKANNVEHMRIVNGTSAATGTTGDITIGDANSGTLRSAKELVMRQDGDVYGPSTLRLRNRGGQNGAVFETTGGSANLVDFIFNTGAVASPISSNIRFETRSGSIKVTGNTTEWQFGQPDVVNGGPTLIVGASGNGSNSALRTGNFGIGTTNPATKLHVFGANPLTLSGVVTGTSTSADSLLTITSGLVRKLPMSTFASTGNAWSTVGNTGTTAGTNFIGTTDAIDFVVKTNSTEKMRVASTGDVAIGGTAFNATNPEQLLVDAGTTSSFNVISGKGNLNNYLQLNIQNNNAGTGASSDVVASNNTATESVNYVDMGINSSGNTSTGVIGGASTAYLYATGNDFAIGNGTANKNLMFFTGGTAANERMRVDGTGNVGIGTTTPSQLLDVNGSISATNSVYVDANNTNPEAKSPGLIFGGPTSGESIISKRTGGGNQYGIDFYTSSNDRMTITSAGNVGIGTITPGYKLTVAGIIAPTADNAYSLGGGTTNRWTVVYATNGIIQTSDRRLKTNITNLNYGLKEVLALQPVGYNWKEKPTAEHKIGLIAQDVRKLVPEVVVGDETKEKLGMNYAELVPVLINAIKEQQKEIDDLKKAFQKFQQ